MPAEESLKLPYENTAVLVAPSMVAHIYICHRSNREAERSNDILLPAFDRNLVAFFIFSGNPVMIRPIVVFF